MMKSYADYMDDTEPACLINGNHDWELDDIHIDDDEDGRPMFIKNVAVCTQCGKMGDEPDWVYQMLLREKHEENISSF